MDRKRGKENEIWREVSSRYKKIGLQWRIMFYVTAGLIVFSGIYGWLSLQAVAEANRLVFQERLIVARAFARDVEDEIAVIELETREKVSTPGSPEDNRVRQNYLRVSAQLAPRVAREFPDYRVELLNETGVTVYSNIEGRQFKVSPHWRIVEPFSQKLESGTDVHQTPIGEHVIAFAPLAQAPWMVIVEQSADEALLLPRQLQFQFFVLGIVTILAGLVLALVTTQRVVKPVNVLIHASKEIARGNLDHPLDVLGEDEIGALARAFDDMRGRVKESREEIARWNRELETRVQRRTRELAALVESSHALTSTLDLDTLFEILIREARSVLPAAEGVALFLVEDATQLLVVRSSHGLDSRQAAQLRFHIGEAIAGQAFETREPTLLISAAQVRAVQANFSPENRAYFAHAVGQREVHSALGVPLVSKGTGLGVLVAYNFSSEGAFASSDVPVLQAFADQAAAAIENAQLYAKLQEKEEMRAHLLEKVIEAQEEERKRIARELHDELAQTLTALTIDLESTVRHLPPEFANLQERLKETETLTTQTLKEISQLILELRPSALDDLGLIPAIRRYAENRLEPRGTKVHIESNGLKHRLPNAIETTLFRIAQETINNAGKYAQASHVHIRLKQSEGLIRLEVEDDGAGFEAEDAFRVKDNWRGLGLLGMRERAVLLGGTLTIESKAGKGTRVRAEIPWERVE